MQSYASALAERREGVTTIVATSPEVPWAEYFNTVAFFEAHKGDARGFYCRLVERKVESTLCVAHFIEKEPGVFVSSRYGAFGGVSAVENDVLLFDIFLEDCERILRTEGARTIRMTTAPFAHDLERSSLVTSALLRRGFTIERRELDQYIMVNEVPLMEKMERNNQKRLRKCQREGLMVAECISEPEWREAYAVIRRNREFTGYPLTMTCERLIELQALFPDRWLSFSVRRGEELVAASVCTLIAKDILYVFSWGDLPEARTLSPITLLADHLYQLCQRRGIRLLDIGVSTQDDLPNPGLMEFKGRLGCRSTLKLTFAKLMP